MTNLFKKVTKCEKCSKEFHGAKYLTDLGYLCEKCMDEERDEE